MQILFGFGLCLFLEGLAWVAWRVWHNHRSPAVPQQPKTPAQLANRAAYEAQEADTPRMVSLRFQRHTKRGRRRPNMEDHSSYLEE